LLVERQEKSVYAFMVSEANNEKSKKNWKQELQNIRHQIGTSFELSHPFGSELS